MEVSLGNQKTFGKRAKAAVFSEYIHFYQEKYLLIVTQSRNLDYW